MDPARLEPNPENPNKHPERQLKIYAQAIELQGWRRAIVVSKRSGLIVMGHGAREVGIRLKCKVPVDFQDFASEAEERAQMLLDHRLPELSEFDSGAALELLGKLEDSELSLAGYDLQSLEELQALAAEAQAESERAREEQDNATEIRPLKIQPPPKMAWVLIGVPIVEFAKVQPLLARLPASAVIKTTANDGPEQKRDNSEMAFSA